TERETAPFGQTECYARAFHLDVERTLQRSEERESGGVHRHLVGRGARLRAAVPLALRPHRFQENAGGEKFDPRAGDAYRSAEDCRGTRLQRAAQPRLAPAPGAWQPERG